MNIVRSHFFVTPPLRRLSHAAGQIADDSLEALVTANETPVNCLVTLARNIVAICNSRPRPAL